MSSSIYSKNIIEDYNLHPVISELYNTLIFERSKQPALFMIRYLINQLNERELSENGIEINGDFIKPESIPIVKYPILDQSGLLKRHLTHTLWNSIKYIKTKYGNKADDIIEENSNIIVPDPDAYNKYSSLLIPLIQELHENIDLNTMLYSDVTGFSKEVKDIESLNEDLMNNIKKINLKSKILIRIKRNLQNFPFVKYLKSSQVKEIKEILGFYLHAFGFDEVNSHDDDDLKSVITYNSETIKFQSKDDKEIFAFVNNENHFELIYLSQKESSTYDLYTSLLKIGKYLESFEKELKFEHSKGEGYLSPNLLSIGYGIEIFTLINTMNDSELLEKLEKSKKIINDNLALIETNDSKGRITIKSNHKIGSNLKTLFYYHINTLFIVNSIKNENNCLKSVFNSNKQLENAYISVYTKLDSINLITNKTLNSFLESISLNNKIDLEGFKYFKSLLLYYFEKDVEKKYFYDYNKENFNLLPVVVNERLSQVISSFQFEIHRLVRGSISEEYIRNIVESKSESESESNSKSTIKFNTTSFKLNNESSDIHKLVFSISLPDDVNSLKNLKEVLINLHDKTRKIFNALESSFIYDYNLGYITDDIESIGTGVKLSLIVTSKNPDIIINQKENYNYSYVHVNHDEKDEFCIKFNTFGMFINKLSANLINFINSICE